MCMCVYRRIIQNSDWRILGLNPVFTFLTMISDFGRTVIIGVRPSIIVCMYTYKYMYEPSLQGGFGLTVRREDLIGSTWSDARNRLGNERINYCRCEKHTPTVAVFQHYS